MNKYLYLFAFLLFFIQDLSAQNDTPELRIVGRVGEATEKVPIATSDGKIVTFDEGYISVIEPDGNSISVNRTHQNIVFVSGDTIFFQENNILYSTNTEFDFFTEITQIELSETHYFVKKFLEYWYFVPGSSPGDIIRFDGTNVEYVFGITPGILDPVNYVESFENQLIISFKLDGFFRLGTDQLIPTPNGNHPFSKPVKISNEYLLFSSNGDLKAFRPIVGNLELLSESTLENVLMHDGLAYGVFGSWHQSDSGDWFKDGSVDSNLVINEVSLSFEWGNTSSLRVTNMVKFPQTNRYVVSLGIIEGIDINGFEFEGDEGLYLIEELINTTTDVPNDTKIISPYPIPAKDVVIFDVPNIAAADEIILYDITGKQISRQAFPQDKQLTVSHLNDGVYIYRIFYENEVYSGKIVVE